MSILTFDDALMENGFDRGQRDAGYGRCPLYIVCSPRRRVGKTLLTRLITEFYLGQGWAVEAYDLADEGPQLVDFLPDLAKIADLGTTRGQMVFFDRLIAEKDTPKVIDVSHRAFKDFFVIANKIRLFEAARRRDIEPIILFLIDPDPVSAKAYSMLQRWFTEASLLPVHNEGISRGFPYWETFPNESHLHVSLEIPMLVWSSTRMLVDQPSFSFARFHKSESTDLPPRQDDELRGFIKRVFRQFREIDLCLKADDVSQDWGKSP